MNSENNTEAKINIITLLRIYVYSLSVALFNFLSDAFHRRHSSIIIKTTVNIVSTYFALYISIATSSRFNQCMQTECSFPF